MTDKHASVEELLQSTRTFGFTANLSVNYRKPLVVKHTNIAILRTRDVKLEGRKLFLEGVLENARGERIADATSLYIIPKRSDTSQNK
jgi:hypothetical protein